MVGYDEVPVVTVGGGVFDRFRRWLRRVIDECWFERVGRKGDSRAVDVNDIVAVIDSFNYLMWTRVCERHTYKSNYTFVYIYIREFYLVRKAII